MAFRQNFANNQPELDPIPSSLEQHNIGVLLVDRVYSLAGFVIEGNVVASFLDYIQRQQFRVQEQNALKISSFFAYIYLDFFLDLIASLHHFIFYSSNVLGFYDEVEEDRDRKKRS